ncbi:HAMP domain-containing sensor histidine kinase [Pseudalkalibacillus salsuginis]|uniref:HAMP domain-containing sensor histidine kinase n=1 Tax=Pseudalkalibacillus salsuginis TaxID=2910972 RepID=UPI001F2A97DD|nr:HAMP domain-containing histidine kinase [Pseudalkalibacillus salsuginis]MCF6410063.1 HAMP domain-containing histidine kinase [Pseudalkalibacillus salsuginis]
MRNLKDLIPRSINIRWKLTLWAALLMLFLFFSYNISQYFVIQNWVVNQEKQTIQKKMEEVTAYIQDSNFKGNVSESEHYLDVLNEKYQLIRIVKENNSPLFTISDEVPQGWVSPKNVTKEELVEFSPKGDRLLIFRRPIEVNGFKGTVEIVRNLENFDSLINQIFMLVIVTGLGGILLSLFGGRLISFQLLKPINSMIRTMKRIKENGLKERVQINKQRDEMTELGIMFNELMDNLEKSFQQQQQFVEDASHELKTPLSIILGHLSLINRWGKDNPKVLERSIHLSLNETNRLIHLVSELLTLSRVEESSTNMNSLEEVKIKEILVDIVENFQTTNNDFEIFSTIDIDMDFTIKILKSHLEQIMIILLDNAIKYSTNEKVIQINVRHTEKQLTIEVKDYGVGIPKEELPFVLNRFYRVDKARSRKYGGNGLGLSIAKRLLDIYQGTIEIDSVYGKWTKVLVSFPLD